MLGRYIEPPTEGACKVVILSLAKCSSHSSSLRTLLFLRALFLKKLSCGLMDFSRRVSKVSVLDAKMSSAKSERSTILGYFSRNFICVSSEIYLGKIAS